MSGRNGGRPRLSPTLKLIKGTYRADRDAKVNADLPIAPMIAPVDLGDRERVHFSDIVQMLEAEKRSSPHYGPLVTILARRLAEIERLSAVIDIEGDTYQSRTIKGDLIVRARPEVSIRSEALRHAQSLLGELMLSPTAALRIASGHKQEPGAFDDF